MTLVAEFIGSCARCKAKIVAEVQFETDGQHEVKPPPIIGSYCDCGLRHEPGGMNGAQAVPLTLREAV